ncbi:glycoside hydrolase family 3 protein [Antrihabitans sp. YC3-6]|uniref:beta-N-acetylhexosaminidase n=1 Tax=Antrihabitans stalagmiti TaxID=2799499 RepID=A0A934U2N4_9NOCA|nr:glycoside hydrolase family 3 N-terminal domain-containing protein [Antrihabitans stalagmiti]MBJ8339314.1 glycoside hydrolase family 3 protein [Antrihabitans stalagmiti]
MRKTVGLVVVLCAVVAGGCSNGGSTSSESASTPGPAASAPPVGSSSASPQPSPPADPCGAEPFLASLSQREKLAQLLTVGVTGPDDAAQVSAEEHVGGIFIGGWTDQSLLTASEMARVKGANTKVPLMVTIDEEGGRVSRIPELIGEEASAREVAATYSAAEAQQRMNKRATEMKKLGITVDFAPDVDVSGQPANSVIGDRSFSDDPAKVTEYGRAYINGLRDAGLGAVIKHFPGHGHGSGDSHTGAVSTPPLDELKKNDLLPFADLVSEPDVAVMVGHLDVPGLTDPNVPTSISPAAMQLLRTGDYAAPPRPFDGVIFTDDLSGMAAITAKYSIETAVEAALVAGADVALWISTDSVKAVLDNLEQAVAAGRLPQKQVDESVLRVARFKGVLSC